MSMLSVSSVMTETHRQKKRTRSAADTEQAAYLVPQLAQLLYRRRRHRARLLIPLRHQFEKAEHVFEPVAHVRIGSIRSAAALLLRAGGEVAEQVQSRIGLAFLALVE